MTYIEREALRVTEIVERKRIFVEGRARTSNIRTKVVTLKDLASAPAADVAPVKHSKWEIIEDDYGNELMRCLECKSEFYDGDNDTVDALHNYCPNCGAKMDLED